MAFCSTLVYRFVMLVSTLDGRVTALNMEDGKPVWSVETGSRPLLSSSISKLEVSISLTFFTSINTKLFIYKYVPLSSDIPFVLNDLFCLHEDVDQHLP